MSKELLKWYEKRVRLVFGFKTFTENKKTFILMKQLCLYIIV